MKHWWHRNRSLLLFIVCMGFLRTAVADWNPIPSASMRPTLLEGDVVLVDRLAYDLKIPLTDIAVLRTGEPKRGDIVTFTSPRDGVRLIKRLVGLPGDEIAMRDDRLIVNGVALAYRDAHAVDEPVAGGTIPALRLTEALGDAAHAVQWLPTVDARRSFGPVTVPAGHYFFLGDNRDDSADSRYIGSVPRALLIGRAHHIVVSAAFLEDWRPRLARFGLRLQ